MSTELMTPNAADVPAHIRKLAASTGRTANEAALAGMTSGATPPQVKLSGKQFTMVDGNGNETPFPHTQLATDAEGFAALPTIMLAAREPLYRQYYIKPYNQNDEPASPDCFSLDNLRPDASVAVKMAESCAACPMYAFNSGKDQAGNASKGKACREYKILAVFVPGFGVNRLRVPPDSFKYYTPYIKQLCGADIPLYMVKTLVSFDPKVSHPVVKFAMGGYLGEDAIPKIMDLIASPEVEAIISIHAATPAPVPATKAPAQEAPAQQAAPATTGRGKKAEPAKQATPAAEMVTDDMGLGLGDMKTANVAPAQQAAPAPSAAEVSDADLRAALGL